MDGDADYPLAKRFLISSSAYGPGAGSNNATARYLCNHRRAYKLFTNSISPKCSSFVAFPCESYERSTHILIFCPRITHNLSQVIHLTPK